VGHSPSNSNVNMQVLLPSHHVNFRSGAYRESTNQVVDGQLGLLGVNLFGQSLLRVDHVSHGLVALTSSGKDRNSEASTVSTPFQRG
jgi:hypothetical protein